MRGCSTTRPGSLPSSRPPCCGGGEEAPWSAARSFSNALYNSGRRHGAHHQPLALLRLSAAPRRPAIKWVPTGIEHGTVTLVVNAQPFEVATLREDIETFGRKGHGCIGRDWVHDAERGDFTINALLQEVTCPVARCTIRVAAGRYRRAAGALYRRSEPADGRRTMPHPAVASASVGRLSARIDRPRIFRALFARAKGSRRYPPNAYEMMKLTCGACCRAMAMVDGGLLLHIFGGIAYTSHLRDHRGGTPGLAFERARFAGSARSQLAASPRTPEGWRCGYADQQRNRGRGLR